MSRRSNVCPPGIALATVCTALLMSPAWNLDAQQLSGDTTSVPLFTSAPTILLRTPDPAKLARFYEALGMKIARVSERGSVVIYLEGNAASLEIVAMDPNTKPGGPKRAPGQCSSRGREKSSASSRTATSRTNPASRPTGRRWRSISTICGRGGATSGSMTSKGTPRPD